MVFTAGAGDVLGPDSRVREPTTVEASRTLAVRRVLRGGLATISGALLTGVAAQFGVASGLPFAATMAGFVAGGFGLIEMGRAAGHFLRYGSRASQIAFVATAALGSSAVLAGVSNWIGVTFGGAIWRFLVHWSMNGVYTFGIVILLCALRALLFWAADSDSEPMSE